MRPKDPQQRLQESLHEMRVQIDRLLAATGSEIYECSLRLDGLRTLEAKLLEAAAFPSAA